MSGLLFALCYIALVYLMLGFFKVAKNGSYDAYKTAAKKTDYIKKDITKNNWRINNE